MAAKTHKPHPVAALFPMLSKDELQEMADDIAERGLLQSIVLDPEGQILDGRNREAACKIAKVEPHYETYEGDDPAGYALATNILRRSLTKGQAAMIAAAARSVSEQSLARTGEIVGVSKTRMGEANTVQKFAPDLVDLVIAGTRTLDEAYGAARRRKQDAASEDAQLADLRKVYPELADKVVEGELTLPAAMTEMRERQARERRDREAATVAAQSITSRIPSEVASILIGVRLGTDGLITRDMISALRTAADQLEEAL